MDDHVIPRGHLDRGSGDLAVVRHRLVDGGRPDLPGHVLVDGETELLRLPGGRIRFGEMVIAIRANRVGAASWCSSEQPEEQGCSVRHGLPHFSFDSLYVEPCTHRTL